MSHLFFCLKTLIAAGLLLSLMQVKISGYTIESRFQYWLQASSVGLFIQGAAVGAVHASQDLYSNVKSYLGHEEKNLQKGERASH